MKSLQFILTIFFFLPVSLYSNQQQIDSLLLRANAEYNSKKYTDAALLYESMVDSGYQSAELYYNIGNSYYKLGDFPHAILNFERALLLDPTNEDIQFNLSKSKTFVVDKIEAIPEFFVKSWFKNSVVMLNSDTWAILAFMGFALAISGFTFFFFMKKKSTKKLVFIASILFSLSFLITGFFSIKTKNYIENSISAIVMSPTVTVKSSPDVEGIDVFIIHEGTKVNVLRSLAGWNEISIADGKQGWLRAEEIEKI